MRDHEFCNNDTSSNHSLIKDHKWKRIDGTQEEIESISQLLMKSGYMTEVFYKTEATENLVKELKDINILHIATHGFFQGNNEIFNTSKSSKPFENAILKSGLIFAGANNAKITNEQNNLEQNDGILFTFKASYLDLLSTQLVVLSACETGLGAINNFEGVYGIRRAFLISGARNLITSLWKVDDEATQTLMLTFYKEFIKNDNIIKSFFKAQRILKNNIKFDHPRYWGSFVLLVR